MDTLEKKIKWMKILRTVLIVLTIGCVVYFVVRNLAWFKEQLNEVLFFGALFLGWGAGMVSLFLKDYQEEQREKK